MDYNSDINSKNYYGCVLNLPSDDPRLKLFQEQRLNRGFDESETWSLDCTIAKFIAPRLKHYHEIDCKLRDPNHPCWSEEEKIEIRKYQNEIFELVHYFENYKIDPIKEYREYSEKILNLFAKHFMGLWW